jgi:clan AA aspartic protease (TIGR02281 family)
MRAFAGFRIFVVFCALSFMGISVSACAQSQEIVVVRKSVSVPFVHAQAEFVGESGGHFPVKCNIGTVEVEFVVDTGASGVAISYQTAVALGLREKQPERWIVGMTAGGMAPMPVFTLPEISVGDIRIENVLVTVLRPGINMNLLGNSFLTRLHRFEYKDGVLTLEQ